ncbi:glycosyltransferase [Candidatus Woesearchaeota archaeon]|nr:glycosyltransferase [Candidatus Woesearchaeota archaeon]
MNALVIFAKFPEPGKVKKKVGNVLGMDASAELCKCFIEDLISENENKDYDLYLSFIGHQHKEEYRSMFPHAILYVQRGSNLSENLRCTFEDLLDDYEKVVVIGCDVPQMSYDTIIKAYNALDSYDVVMGPASDGGYYLVGLKKPTDIFDDMPWGSEALLSEQTSALEKKGLTYVLLDVLDDVDTFEELIMLKNVLKRQDAPKTFDFIQGLDTQN